MIEQVLTIIQVFIFIPLVILLIFHLVQLIMSAKNEQKKAQRSRIIIFWLLGILALSFSYQLYFFSVDEMLYLLIGNVYLLSYGTLISAPVWIVGTIYFLVNLKKDKRYVRYAILMVVIPLFIILLMIPLKYLLSNIGY